MLPYSPYLPDYPPTIFCAGLTAATNFARLLVYTLSVLPMASTSNSIDFPERRYARPNKALIVAGCTTVFNIPDNKPSRDFEPPLFATPRLLNPVHTGKS
ncbi:MAG: hypothetical protein KME40_03775 [Komarekiella atlantica HA4396-MV6]|nr:hypothetical protein [Komarekiella atlantica HA4396-MV6]